MQIKALCRVLSVAFLLNVIVWGLVGEVGPIALSSTDEALTTIATALDANGNDILDDDEIREVVQLWITRETVPGTDLMINDDLIRELIRF